MANDQLSWDQLLKIKDEAEAAELKAKNTLAPEAPSSRADTQPQTETKKPRKTKKTKTENATVPQTAVSKSTGLADLYSKKDWSKLEPPVETAAVATKEASKEIVAKKTVSIPVVKTPTDLPYEPDADVVPKNSKDPKVISVSELNRYIKDILEGRFPTIWVKAEISNFKAHTSGHFYFSLKDAKAQISAVMFRGHNSQLRFRPEDGMEVLVRGKITVYEPRGNYQIFCEMMEPVGAGALQKAYEQLKAKLQREGLFDEARKRPLPTLPRHIAIVTSPTGAAIRDMLNVLARRFRGVRITVIPCKVQGDQAPAEIVEAIALAQKLQDVDVMIVGRGGGSIEDLWAFNDERVARAISGARMPVISAVGHEVDFTIADFVADLRAPTPSAAAELVVRNAADLVDRLRDYNRSMRLALARSLGAAREQLGFLSKRLIDPQRRIQDAALRCDELLQRLEMATLRAFGDRRSDVLLLRSRLGTPQTRISHTQTVVATLAARLRSGIQTSMIRKRDSLSKNVAVLDSLSPLKVLDRGFSMVMVGDKIVTDAKDLKVGDSVSVRMCQGQIEAKVTEIKEDKKR